MDADLQDPPEVINKMLDSFNSDLELHVVHTTELKDAMMAFLNYLITIWI